MTPIETADDYEKIKETRKSRNQKGKVSWKEEKITRIYSY